MANKQERDFHSEATSYFEKARQQDSFFNEHYNFEYLQKQQKYYEDFYSKTLGTKSSNEIDKELDTIRGYITSVLDNELTDNYSFSGMIQYVTRLKILEAKRDQVFAAEEEIRIKEAQAKQNRNEVVQTFGDFQTEKRVDGKNGNFTMAQKSSTELTAERDERLAVLEQMRKSKMLSPEEFAKKVVAVQQTYKPAIETSLLKEAEDLAKKEIEDAKLINRVKSKIKNIFNFGKKEPSIDEADLKDPQKAFVQKEALSSLVEAERILGDGSEAQACLDEAMNIGESITVEHNPEVLGILSEYAQAKLEEIEEKYAEDPNRDTYIELQEQSNRCLGEVTNYSETMGGTVVRDEADLKREKFEISNFMLGKFEHETIQTLGTDGPIIEKHIFKNPDDERVYNEVMNYYNSLENDRQIIAGEYERLNHMAMECTQSMDM